MPLRASVGDFNGGVEAVAVYRLGKYGTAIGESLARVALSGPSVRCRLAQVDLGSSRRVATWLGLVFIMIEDYGCGAD